MKKFIARVVKTGVVTYNVKRIVVNRPAGYRFIPGQAAAISIPEPAFRNLSRPFSIVPVNGTDQLEFYIRDRTGYDEFTGRLLKRRVGEELILHQPAGSLLYKGKGLFIAGGMGIAPFMAIFRRLETENQLAGNTLLFANQSAADIILKEELEAMLGKNYLDVLETTKDPLTITGFIGSKLLKEHKKAHNEYYYIYGPGKFTIIMIKHLLGLGIDRSKIVFDDKSIEAPPWLLAA